MSKSGTAVDVLVHKERLRRVLQQGSGSARFHECANCGVVVLVTADIDGNLHGALNAQCMNNTVGFPVAIKTDFSGDTAEQKRDRWRHNWCHPVIISSPGGEASTTSSLREAS